jgi:UDP-N-acetylmuramoyl-L-alanyl-D-glutamate--2,6-diaminopimelate ligase
MKLRDLIAGVPIRSIAADLDTEVHGLAYDSRKVSSGFVFVAIRGMQTDGNRFVPQAIANGAGVIVSSLPPVEGGSASWVQVHDDREALAGLAAAFYRRPSEELRLTGITGTNGKTTTAYIVESILKAAGHRAALLGTIEYRGPGSVFSAERTTPESLDLQQFFRQVVDAGWRYAVMEVSSHAIQLKRVSELRFEVAAFTNLSRDHLDFHGDMRSYFEQKKKLFQGLDGVTPRVMILNYDDPHYSELSSIDPSRVISYGMESAADICPTKHEYVEEGTEAAFKTPMGTIEIRSSLVGTPNLYNIGAAIGVAAGLGLPRDSVRKGIQDLPNVPGRFELIHRGQPFKVIVDYAHTDDALAKVLKFARELTSGKLMVVFGCGGDRDRTKRPLMGSTAANNSDFAIVTSDNPRSEDPAAIAAEVEQGLRRAGAALDSQYAICLDRREAIRLALARARPGDTVVIAGKGHEKYQTIGKQTLSFDDRDVARELLDELIAGRNH